MFIFFIFLKKSSGEVKIECSDLFEAMIKIRMIDRHGESPFFLIANLQGKLRHFSFIRRLCSANWLQSKKKHYTSTNTGCQENKKKKTSESQRKEKS